MNTVNWPAQQLTLSKLAFGCAPIMGRIGRRQAMNAMAAAFDAGVTHFDVARSYGFGDAERVVGRFLHGRRNAVTVATKFGIQPQALTFARRLARPLARTILKLIPDAHKAMRRGSASMLATGHYSLAEARASLHTSLQELGTETVDLLLIHECTRSDPVHDDLIAWLHELRRQGKIRAWGFAAGGEDADYYRTSFRDAGAIFQRELRAGDFLEAEQGTICHSPFSLLPGLAATSAGARHRLDAWTRSHNLRAEELPLLLLESALQTCQGRVILCSMFKPGHVRANLQCFTHPRFSPDLQGEFLRLIAETQNPGTMEQSP